MTMVCALLLAFPSFVETLGLDTLGASRWDVDARGAVPHARWIGLLVSLLFAPVLLGSLAGVRWLLRCLRRTADDRMGVSPSTGGAGASEADASAARAVEVEEIEESFEQLCAWLRDDREITRADEDRFAFRAIAERMRGRLTKVEDDGQTGRPTMALVGDYGSGKSSVIALLEGYLREAPQTRQGAVGHGAEIRLVSVSLWPYATTEAAVEGILERLVREAGRHVSVLGLTRIPEAYRQAIGSLSGVLGSVAHALSNMGAVRPTPEALLQRLDDRLAAIGLHLVLAIEDLERFAPEQQAVMASPQAVQSGAARQAPAPITALLHLLDRLSCVTVILVTTPPRQWFDIHKMARFVEQMPPIPEEHARRLLARFRRGCLDQLAQQGLIDPGQDAPRRRELDAELAGENGAWRQAAADLGYPSVSLVQALSWCASNPRRTKHALRTCLEAWGRLIGEIDFDDLLAMSLWREAEPEFFAEVEANVRHLRGEELGRAVGDINASPARDEPSVRGRLLDEMQRVRGVRARHVAEAVLDFVFATSVEQAEAVGAERPQGLGAIQQAEARGDGDYWRRFTSQLDLEPGSADQPILRAIRAWGDERRHEELVELLLHPTRGWAVVHFAKELADETVLDLLDRVVNGCVARGARASAPHDDHEQMTGAIYCMHRIVRMWCRRDFHQSTGRGTDFLHRHAAERDGYIAERVEALVRSSVPLNIEVAHVLALLEWTERPEHNERWMKALLDGAASAFDGEDPQQLVDALAGAEWRLSYELWALPTLENRLPVLLQQRPHAWGPFAAALLSAGETGFDGAMRVLPQILPFVTRQDPSSREWAVDETQAEARFGWGAGCQRLWQLFREYPLDAVAVGTQWRAPYEAVQRYIKGQAFASGSAEADASDADSRRS